MSASKSEEKTTFIKSREYTQKDKPFNLTAQPPYDNVANDYKSMSINAFQSWFPQ